MKHIKALKPYKGTSKVAILSEAPRLQHTPANPESFDWDTLGFSYVPSKRIVAYNWTKEKGWSAPRLQPPSFDIHAMSNALHYGQAVFEGLKAFHTANDDIHVFNSPMNSKRLQNSAKRLGMPQVPESMFQEALDIVIKDNKEYVPPFGTNGSLYLRPFQFGHGPRLGLGPADEYIFAVQATPVGSYYKTGPKPVDAVVLEGYDRAAPHGVGNVKCAGNYAADVLPSGEASKRGFPIVLYLDAKESKYVEEFSTSNLVAIDAKGKKFITPKSESILPSITNIMLQQLAKDAGLKVEVRPVEFSELATMKEIAACGTAVVITPIKSITDERLISRTKENKPVVTKFTQDYDILRSLYEKLRAIQCGTEKDIHGWCRVVCKGSD